MTKHTIETVTFKLVDGISREVFAKYAEAITDFARKQAGFVSHRLSCSDDVEWETLAAAKSGGNSDRKRANPCHMYESH